jgi:hypothetical protein
MNTSTTNRSTSYTNGALTAIAVLLGVIALQNTAFSGGGATVAHASEPGVLAQGGDDTDVNGRISAAEQRKQIIAELRTIQTKMDRLEQTLNKGLNVKVIDMPELKLPAELRRTSKDQNAAPESGVRVSPSASTSPAPR